MNDCWGIILQMISDGRTYKSAIFTCHFFYDSLYDVKKIKRFTNNLMTIYRAFSDKKWDHKKLVREKSFLLRYYDCALPNRGKFRLTHPEDITLIMQSVYDESLRYGTHTVLSCSAMTEDIFMKYLHLSWDILVVAAWPKLTPEMMVMIISHKKVSPYIFISSAGMTLSTAKNVYGIDAAYHDFSKNPNVKTIYHEWWSDDWARRFKPRTPDDWVIISNNLNSPWDKKNLRYPADDAIRVGRVHPTIFTWGVLTITDIDLLLLHQHDSIDWTTSSAKISINAIRDHPNLPWSMIGLCLNPNIDITFVESTPFLNWDIERFISYRCFKRIPQKTLERLWRPHFSPMTLAYAHDYKVNDSGLPWRGMSRSINISEIIKNTHINWNWSVVSQRKDLPITFVIEHPDIFESRWQFLSAAQHIDVISAHPDLPWDHETGTIKNPTLTLDFILDHPNVNWDFRRR